MIVFVRLIARKGIKVFYNQLRSAVLHFPGGLYVYITLVPGAY